MKIAICFSGQLREIGKTIDYYKTLSSKYDIDFYGSFWETVTEPHQQEEKKLTIEEIEQIKSLGFKDIEFEDFQSFKKSTLKQFFVEFAPPYYPEVNFGLSHDYETYLFSGALMSMYYKIWRCNNLTKNDNYDIVVRTRTDIYMDDNLQLLINEYLNIPEHFAVNTSWLNCIGPTDTFAYGNQDVMDYYSSVFIYLTRYLKEGHYFFPAENILKVHLSQRNVLVRHFPSQVFFARTNTSLTNQSPNEYISEYNLLHCVLDHTFSFYKAFNK